MLFIKTENYMELKQFFDLSGGNYESAINRFLDESRIKKFLKLFLLDDSYSNLLESIDKKDFKNAFRASHNLKGVVSNLSLDTLYTYASDICECLRYYNETFATQELLNLEDKVVNQYNLVVRYIKELGD